MALTQPLSPNEIRDRALHFAREWQGERREHAAFLFALYQKYTTLLLAAEKPKRVRKRGAH